MTQQDSQQKQILQMVVKALSQGAKPEELVKALSSKGLPQKAATEMVKAGVGYIQQQGSKSDQFARAMAGNSLPEYGWGAAVGAVMQNPQFQQMAMQMLPQVMGMFGNKGGDQQQPVVIVNPEDNRKMKDGGDALPEYALGAAVMPVLKMIGPMLGGMMSGQGGGNQDGKSMEMLSKMIPKAQTGINETGLDNQEGEFDFFEAVQQEKKNSGAPYAQVTTDYQNPAEASQKVAIAQSTLDPNAEPVTPVSEDGKTIDYSKIDNANTQGAEIIANAGENEVIAGKFKDKKPPKFGAANYEDLKELGLYTQTKSPGLTMLQGVLNMTMGGTDMMDEAFGKKAATRHAAAAGENIKSAAGSAKYGGKTPGKFKPHMMYKPSTGESEYANTYEKHMELFQKGYEHQDKMKWGGSKKIPKYEIGTIGTVDNGINTMATPNWANKPIEPQTMYAGLNPVENSSQGNSVTTGTSSSNVQINTPEGGYSSGEAQDYGVAYDDDGKVNQEMTMENWGRMNEGAAENTGAKTEGDNKDTEERTGIDDEGLSKPYSTDQFMLGLDQFATGLEMRKAKKAEKKQMLKERAESNTMNQYEPEEGHYYGYGTTNRGLGADFRLSEHNYGNYSKYGGLSKFLGGGITSAKEGDEMVMTEEELAQFIQMGGQVEILEDNIRPRY
jgi:hypothetical protein